MTGAASPRIAELEGLRGLCALSVLLSHLSYDSTGFRTGGASHFPGYPADFIASFGSIGVLIFFVLSGFVIGTSTTEAFSKQAVKLYFRRRLLRLYPIYIVALVASFWIAGESLLSRSFLVHLAFLQTWLEPTISTNGVLWTLHMEMMFYLLFLLVWSELVSLRVALVISAACCLVSPFVELHFVRVGAYFHVWLLGLWASRLRSAAQALDARLFWPAVLIGIATARLSAIEAVVHRWDVSGHGQLSTVGVLALSGALLAPVAVLGGAGSPRMRTLVLGSIAISGLSCLAGVAHALQPHVPHVSSHAIAPIFLGLGVLAALARFGPPMKQLAGLSWLGGLSYALYVIQNPVEHAVFPRVPAGRPGGTWWTVCLAILCVVFALSYLLERRFQPAVARLVRR